MAPPTAALQGPLTAHASIGVMVDGRIDRFLTAERRRWEMRHPRLGELAGTLHGFACHGGKRLRAAFCHEGWLAAGGDGDPAAVVDVAAALELLHAFALIHDDVMDGSAERRGRPSLHRQMQDAHAAMGGRGDSRRFGEGMAVLVGDAALAWADCLLAPHRPLVGAVWDELRVELTMGQFLDVVGSSGAGSAPGSPSLVATLKSARYTVTRPLQLGAAVAGRLDEMADIFTRFGDPVGRAFQLRDDLLGVYGDPRTTGKPAGEDLREGKPTLLLEAARRRATGSALDVLATVGSDLDDDGVDRLRGVMAECGAVAAVEAEIARCMEVAAGALEASPLDRQARLALLDLAASAAWRQR